MRRKLKRIPGGAILMLAAGSLAAEPVEITYNQTATFGQSVFVTTELPSMGGNTVAGAVKMSGTNRPDWFLRVDLPPGTTITPTFYLRNDLGNELVDPQNGVLLPSTGAIDVPFAPNPPFPVFLYTDAGTTEADVVITSPTGTPPPERIEMIMEDGGPDGRIFTATIPAGYRAFERQYQIETNLETLPADGPAEIQPSPVWWRFGEGFLYDPADLTAAPSPPRQETFIIQLTNTEPRDIRVQLPRGYDESPDKDYPVLLVQWMEESFSTGGMPVTWDADVAATEVTRRGEAPEMIVAGIGETTNSVNEWTPEYAGAAGMGATFLVLLKTQLLPEIRSRYRARRGPGNNAHLASGLAALVVYQSAADFSDVWSSCGGISTLFWQDFTFGTQGSLIRAQRGPEDFARVYMDAGTFEEGNDDLFNNMRVRDAMIDSGFVMDDDLMFRVALGDEPGPVYWRERAPGAIRWIWREHVEQIGIRSLAQSFFIVK